MLDIEINEWRSMSIFKNNIIEIGIGLTLFGLLFTLLGVLMFFDKGLIAMGNVKINF